MTRERPEHVPERFVRLLAPYRKPDGSEWGGQDLENATFGAVGRSYFTNLRRGWVQSPGLDKLAAIYRVAASIVAPVERLPASRVLV